MIATRTLARSAPEPTDQHQYDIMPDRRQILGTEGERAAEQFLRRQRYTIVERNYRCPLGEVDLIARDGRVLVFVEVKTRTAATRGTPFEAVNRRKQRQIRRTAQYFIAQHQLYDRNARFDVVGVWRDGDRFTCEVVGNAFDAER